MNTPDWVMTILTFFVGYAVGQGKITKESILEAEKKVYKSVKGKIKPVKLGTVDRPSAKKVNLWQNKQQKETEEAMSESLEKFFGGKPPIKE